MNKATTGNRNLYETRPSAVTKSTGTANVTEMSKNTTDSRKIPDVNNTERSPETGSFEKQADEITKAADKMKKIYRRQWRFWDLIWFLYLIRQIYPSLF